VFLSEQSGRAELLINSHQQIQQRLQADRALGVTRLDPMSGPCGPGARGHGRDPAHPQPCSMIPESRSVCVLLSVFLQPAEPLAPALFWCVAQPLSLSLSLSLLCVCYCVFRSVSLVSLLPCYQTQVTHSFSKYRSWLVSKEL